MKSREHLFRRSTIVPCLAVSVLRQTVMCDPDCAVLWGGGSCVRLDSRAKMGVRPSSKYDAALVCKRRCQLVLYFLQLHRRSRVREHGERKACRALNSITSHQKFFFLFSESLLTLVSDFDTSKRNNPISGSPRFQVVSASSDTQASRLVERMNRGINTKLQR